jgi:hypothetical protein
MGAPMRSAPVPLPQQDRTPSAHLLLAAAAPRLHRCWRHRRRREKSPGLQKAETRGGARSVTESQGRRPHAGSQAQLRPPLPAAPPRLAAVTCCRAPLLVTTAATPAALATAKRGRGRGALPPCRGGERRGGGGGERQLSRTRRQAAGRPRGRPHTTPASKPGSALAPSPCSSARPTSAHLRPRALELSTRHTQRPWPGSRVVRLGGGRGSEEGRSRQGASRGPQR